MLQQNTDFSLEKKTLGFQGKSTEH